LNRPGPLAVLQDGTLTETIGWRYPWEDHEALPYADGTFDAAYLVATPGEVPDQDAALRELRRVLRPGGHLVVGEGLPDPHMIPFATLRRRAEAAGLRLEHRHGGRLGYCASIRVP
jgi:ubiquinone/menaquinone biosynthesis C-methylase UbiE